MISLELYDIIEGILNEILESESKCGKCGPGYVPAKQTPWIHLRSAVYDTKTITPMDAYDSVGLGYVPEYLLIRKSKYSHLL